MQRSITVRSNRPFFRSTEVRAKPSGTPRNGSGIRTVTTVPSSLKRNVIVDEQPGQSQKYSTRLDFEPSVGSPLRRYSLSPLKYRNEAKHEGLLHFATMTSSVLPEFLCWLRHPPGWDEV